MNWAQLASRWRVRLSYPFAILVLWFARPVPASILYGAIIGVGGLLLRAYAAGYLHKQEVLTIAGPYAYTRNPLYLGSAIMAAGAAVAMRSWPSALLICAYFGIFYYAVMRREEQELRMHHGDAFEQYARSVPLFFPRLRPATLAFGPSSAFSFVQYKRNREYRAAIGFSLLMMLLLVIWRLRLP